jgi:hypothetical protein
MFGDGRTDLCGSEAGAEREQREQFSWSEHGKRP